MAGGEQSLYMRDLASPKGELCVCLVGAPPNHLRAKKTRQWPGMAGYSRGWHCIACHPRGAASPRRGVRASVHAAQIGDSQSGINFFGIFLEFGIRVRGLDLGMVGTSTTSKMFTQQKKFALENMNTCHRVTKLYTPDEIHTVLDTLNMFFLMYYTYMLHSDLPEGPKVSCLVVERSQLSGIHDVQGDSHDHVQGDSIALAMQKYLWITHVMDVDKIFSSDEIRPGIIYILRQAKLDQNQE